MTGTNLDLHTHSQNSLYNASSHDTTLKLIDTTAGFVDIEAPNNNHFWWGFEVSYGHRYFIDRFTNSIDVVLELGRYWDDWSLLTDGILDEVLNLFVVFNSLLLLFENNINLVLQNDNVLKLHNF